MAEALEAGTDAAILDSKGCLRFDLVSQVSRSYDGLMRLTRESQSIREGSARYVDYAYDKAANVLTLTYPSGTTIATSYDALGRGDVLTRDGNPIADYDYLGGASGGRLKTLTFEAGTDDVQLTQTFDGLGRLTRMTYAQTGNAGLPTGMDTHPSAV
ncbi:MAG: hypothetical protein ACOCZU_09270 [Planctomycetota bacterium]